MIYCLNPCCLEPINPDSSKYCQSCGAHLLLRNRYRAIKYIGGGGFGKTYQAVDLDCMNASCVVKQFSPSADIQADPVALSKATEMFNQEARRLLQLGEHPQIPRLLAFFEQDKQLYLVQEFINGMDLKQELTIEGAFNEQKIRQLLTDLLPVLKFIHARGVIHRDIKPGNIMRRHTAQNQKLGRLMLIDFGVSKLASGTVGTVGTTVGTAGYTPLEQMRGQAFPASDLYSLGVTCVCLLTQHLPKVDGSGAVYDAMQCRWLWRDYLPQKVAISQELGQVLDKLLQDLPKDRYQSADEVLKDLKVRPGILRQTIPIAKVIPALANGDNLLKPVLGGKLQGDTEVVVSAEVPTSTPQQLEIPVRDRLVADVWVNYRKLSQLLIQKRWKEADFETKVILLSVAGRTAEGWMRAEDFKKFPCQDLCRLDRLWVNSSSGRFGYSVQKQVWESIGGKIDLDYTIWCKFGDRLGWRRDGNWLDYADLTFDQDTAPLGHLPAGGVDGIVLAKWDLVGSALAARLVECQHLANNGQPLT
jgi:serine/threonine protein kinase